MNQVESDIRIAAIATKGGLGAFLRLIGPGLDRILGVRKLRLVYERHNLRGLGAYEFLEQFIKANKIRYSIDKEELANIPTEGPVILTANHPLGGLEGIILAHLLKNARTDFKIFVNIMLYMIREMRDFFIFANPMNPGSKANFKAICDCRKLLKQGHCLLVFPAGRVGLYRADKGYITDESWDQFALSLGLTTHARFVPVFVGGSCSAQFSWMCRLFFPMKLLWLVREFLDSFKKEISFSIGRPIDDITLRRMPRIQANAYLRMRTYLLAPLRTEDGTAYSEKDRKETKINALIAAARHKSSTKSSLIFRKTLTDHHSKNHSLPCLHNEVYDYINRYGLNDSELKEISSSI